MLQSKLVASSWLKSFTHRTNALWRVSPPNHTSTAKACTECSRSETVSRHRVSPDPDKEDKLMALLLTFLKLLLVLFFLYKFIRSGRVVWAIGLLTVTTALLLDTFIGTLGGETTREQLGFFYEVLRGGLFAGAALWLFGLLRPQTFATTPAPQPVSATPFVPPSANEPAWNNTPADPENQPAVDRQMLYNQIRYRLSPDELLDTMFDIGINENDVLNPNQEMAQIIVHYMDVAEKQGKLGDLALAVERILTEFPAESLPRLEKLTVDSPPTVLRHFLVAHYTLEQLLQMAQQLGMQGDIQAYGGKRTLARQMLLYLYRRNRLLDLLDLMQEELAPEHQPTP